MPKVIEVIVGAGRTFNHPYESYSNFRPSVTVKADVLDSEDWQAVVKDLQAKAEGIVENHKQTILKSIYEPLEPLDPDDEEEDERDPRNFS